MSGMSVTAAIASLQPGTLTSPESALQSWTVLNKFNHSMDLFTKTSFQLSAFTTVLLAISIASTLYCSYRPSAERTDRTYSIGDKLNATLSAVLRVFIMIIGSSLMTGLAIISNGISKQLIADWQSVAPTSSMPDLRKWEIQKSFIEYCPKLVGKVQNRFLWIGIGAAVACGATLQAVRSQKEKNKESIMLGLDLTSILPLGVVTIISLYGFGYAKNFSNQMPPSI